MELSKIKCANCVCIVSDVLNTLSFSCDIWYANLIVNLFTTVNSTGQILSAMFTQT